MSFFSNITGMIGRRKMWREARIDRQPIVCNLNDAAKVGIVYYAADEKAFEQIKHYVRKIKEDIGISKIMALGYYEGKHMPHYLNSRLNFEQFGTADLNWYHRPSGNTVENFIAEPYDVLIDLSLQHILPIQFIVGRSRASFKVGRYSEDNEELLDMMIDVAGGQSLRQLIRQVDRYLLMVNAKNHEDA